MRNFFSTLMIHSFLFFLIANTSMAQSDTLERWWPHPEWGEADQAGASNRITPEVVLRALSSVRLGKIYELSFIHEPDMPLSGKRSYKLITPSFPTGGPAGKHNIVWNDDYFSGELGHLGTQFDAPAHIGKRIRNKDGTFEDIYYNGFTGAQLKSPYGVKKLGIEHIRPFITNCYLIDIAAYKNLSTLEDGYTITLEDVLGAMNKQGIRPDEILVGDAVFFNFGWWKYWQEDEKYTASRPGIGPDVAHWLIGKKISVVGSDNSTDQGATHAVHFDMIVKHGIMNLEFMNFGPLLEDRIDRFVLVFTPLRFKGATGSPARPIAIY